LEGYVADIDEEQLKRLRALGVKQIDLRKDGSCFVEFFERGLLDVDALIPGADTESMPTDRPPPAEGGPPNVPPAITRILKRGSVS